MEEIYQNLNVKGEVCPIPAAETRRALKSISMGQVLEIIGDFEDACENVVNMAKKNGGEIMCVEHSPNYFRVVVKKVQ